MALGITNTFQNNLSDIDAIFEVSKSLKLLYLTGLRHHDQNETYSQKHCRENAIKTIDNITKYSIEEAEKDKWNKLYTQAIVLIVSNAEQLLKELFENLIFSNLDQVNKLDKVFFSFDEIKKLNFNPQMNDWRELIKQKLYGENNPKERINFQNIQSIIGTFKGFFNLDINIPDNIALRILYFYQCRHVIVHNGGQVDQKFVDIVHKVLHKDVVFGTKINISESEYKECKHIFLKLFQDIELSIEHSSLNYSELVIYKNETYL